MTLSRSVLRYHGAKNRLAPRIIERFPPHVCYCEPFGGSAGVLLRKAPASFEVYNDLDEDVVNFFRVLREQPDALVRLIDLTPYSMREWDSYSWNWERTVLPRLVRKRQGLLL